MRYFVTPNLPMQNENGSTRVCLYRFEEWTFEYDREMTYEQAIDCLENGDEFVTVHVYQNMFIRIAPIRLTQIKGKECLSVEHGVALAETFVHFPESWMIANYLFVQDKTPACLECEALP
jgi:hypothetical protein